MSEIHVRPSVFGFSSYVESRATVLTLYVRSSRKRKTRKSESCTLPTHGKSVRNLLVRVVPFFCDDANE